MSIIILFPRQQEQHPNYELGNYLTAFEGVSAKPFDGVFSRRGFFAVDDPSVSFFSDKLQWWRAGTEH